MINLSRDSSYRESITHGVEGALYRARRMTIEGAAMIDLGAESTGESADLLDVDAQLSSLLPVVRAITDEGMLVSAETYHTDVAVAALEAGAGVVNLTGRVDEPELYEAIARHEAGLILCYTPGETARSDDELPSSDVLIDEQMAFFAERLELATSAGIERIWIDPGFGFALKLPDGPERVRYQTDSMLQSFRFRRARLAGLRHWHFVGLPVPRRGAYCRDRVGRDGAAGEGQPAPQPRDRPGAADARPARDCCDRS